MYIVIASYPGPSHVFQRSRATLKNMGGAWVRGYIIVMLANAMYILCIVLTFFFSVHFLPGTVNA